MSTCEFSQLTVDRDAKSAVEERKEGRKKWRKEGREGAREEGRMDQGVYSESVSPSTFRSP